MKHSLLRGLSILLALVMVLSMVPAAVFATDTATTWTRVSFSAITAEDTVAITMSKDGVTYVLPTAGNGSSGQPLAEIGTVEGDTLTTTGDGFGWTIAPTEGGYTIQCENGYLYSENTNNGTRIGETAAVWNLDAESNYLATVVADTTRYLGVYINGLDWRCYKTWASGNTMGQTIDFWVKGGSAPVVPTEPEESEPTEPVETEPVPSEPAAPAAGEAVLTTELMDGMKVYIYNPANARVLTSNVSGAVLASVPGTVENDVLTVEADMAELTVIADASGAWLFANAEGQYLTAGTGSNMLTFEAEATEYSLWNAEAVEGGFLVPNVTAKYNDNALYLEYYKENFTTYTYQQWNSKPYVMQFFCSGTASSGEFVSTLESGDRVVIYNPTYSMGLSNEIQNTDKNYDLVGTPLTLEGDTLTGWGENNIFDVTVDAEGKVSFTDAAGQKLAVVSRTHLGFAEEATAWTLQLIEGKTDEFYVGSGQGTFLEWYADKNYWSAYYNPSEPMYAIRFYAVSGNGGSVQPSNVVAAPKAGVKAGVVDSGTEISFTCATEGASILYHLGDGIWTEYQGPIAIYEDTTFTVKAVKEGMEDSKEVSFAYTIYVPPVLGEDQAVLVTDISQLQSGDRILIVTKDYDFALGTTQKDNNRDYAEVIKAYDKLSYNEFAQIITLESGVEADTWALYATNGETTGYLYAPEDSGNLLRTQSGKDLNGSWTITINSDGTAAITSRLDKKSNTIRYNTVGIFSCYGATGQKPVCIYELIEEGNERPGLPAEGDQVVLYNQAAKGVLGGVDGDITDPTSCTVLASAASIAGGKAVCSNGALVFEVQRNGEYYRLFNASFGYLSSTGGGNNTFYSFDTADADWVVEEYNGGYRLGSRTAVFNDNMQYLQYFAEHFTTWGMYAVTDRDVFTYHFYPCASDKITDGVVNEPMAVFGNLAPAYAGQRYLLHFTVDALFGVKEIAAYLGETELELTVSGERYTAEIPADLIEGESLTVTVKGLDNKDVAIESSVVIEVKDEPVISDMLPLANSQTKDNKRPTISAKLTNVGEAPAIELLVNGEAVEAVLENGFVTYTPAADMADGRVTVTLTVTRADGKSVSKSWSFIVGESNYQMYFGQLHSHTTYSDGSGTLESALEYIGSLPEEANVDFVAFTDHSNYFDKSGEANPEGALYDMSLATAFSQETWKSYKDAIANFNASQSEVVALGGFEMTWSGGPGHMNTFATPGIVSRNNTALNNKSSDAGMRLYYSLLGRPEGKDSITQLNHPGATFGNFTDFAYWDESYDAVVQLVEVGNGEGQVGAGGYYPSYEEYTLALDKGWHVAPTNNQDNHKGKWGNGNDARDVVLAESLTEESIYDAIRARRVYATEDKNLQLTYTVNDLPMGTVIESVPEKLRFDITIQDPDSTDSTVKAELIVNSGKVAYTWSDAAALATGVLTAELDPSYSYYYLRVTQADGNLAVTAPVWVGDSLMLGIDAVTASTVTPVTGEHVTLTAKLHNGEASDGLVKSVVWSIGDQILSVDSTVRTLTAGSDLELTFDWVPETAKKTAITATVVVELESTEYTFSASAELDVRSAEDLAYILIDGSHSNEYVAGYNKELMGNFAALANNSGIRTETAATGAALLEALGSGKYAAIVLNVPSRRLSEGKVYSQEELAALKAFNEAGGVLIVTGSGDSNDKLSGVPHMAATQNALLEYIGSDLRLADDGTYEDSSYSLSFNAWGSNLLTEGLTEADMFSYYGGSSVYTVDGTIPATVSPVLFANENTISKDADGDGNATATYDGRLMVMALEQKAGKGAVVVAGSAFMNDYDLTLPVSNGNGKVSENLFKLINPVKVADIADVHAAEEGMTFTIEGIVTSNASGFDKDTAFFDCIYLQDATAGINAFPVAGNFKIGDLVRITGTTSSYQGERQISVSEIELISEGHEVAPIAITASELNDGTVLGSLVTMKGTVESFEYANGLIQTIMVKDEKGEIGRVFIDGYITTAYDVENLAVGCDITVTGLASYDNSFDGPAPRIRVRDRKDVVCTASAEPEVKVLAEGWSGYTLWKLTDDGVLTVSPSGQLYNGQCNMKNYWKVNGVLTLPWSDYAELITKVVVEEGVNAIGQMAFYDLPNLKEVVLASTVWEIRNYAFKNCESLTTVDLTPVTMFREGCFYGCSNLTDVTFGPYFGLEDFAFSKTPVKLYP